MASELRVNTITSTTGVGTVTLGSGGVSFSGTPTFNDVTLSSINSGALAGTRNKFINGNFDIWQRGSSLTAQGANGLVYLADRWAIETWGSTTARVTYDRALDAPTVGGTVGFSSYSARITVTTTSSNPTNDFGVFRQFIEGYNAQDLYQRPFTISFWVKSSLVGTYALSAYGGGASPGQTAGTPSFTQTYTINNANTWEYKIIQVPACPAGTYSNWDFGNGRGFDIIWRLWSNPGTYSGSFGIWNTTQYSIPGATTNFAGTNGATWQIAQVQLEVGTVATPFERRLIGQEIALCQRYYEKSYSQDVVPGTATVVGQIMQGPASVTAATVTERLTAIFKVTKRVNSPTLTWYDSAGNSGKCNLPDTTTNRTVTQIYQNDSSAVIEATAGSSTSDWRMYAHFVCNAEL